MQSYLIRANVNCIRLWVLYKRFIKTWIRIILWSQILTPKRFDSCSMKRILDLYRIIDHESGVEKICFEL
jgi:hypothetical protein